MALDIITMVVAGAGASWGWWQLQRRRSARIGLKELESAFEDDAKVVITVAMHAMKSRAHPEMWPIHLLYGLLQDEAFTSAIQKLDGDPDLAETQVLAALEERKVEPNGAPQVMSLLNHCYAVSRHLERKVSVAELATYVLQTDAAAFVAVDTYELRFVLAHGMKMPPADLPGRTDVAVVIRNDHHSTFEFVMGLLQNLFDLSAADAKARATQTHTEGRAVIGRFKLPVARDKLIAARSRAREQAFPLWIGLEDI